jgi:hypothetical protein
MSGQNSTVLCIVVAAAQTKEVVSVLDSHLHTNLPISLLLALILILFVLLAALLTEFSPHLKARAHSSMIHLSQFLVLRKSYSRFHPNQNTLVKVKM